MLHLRHWPALAVGASFLVGFLLVAAALLRARYSRYPALLCVCAAYMVLLHAVWIAGLLAHDSLYSEFELLNMLTFPWRVSVSTNMAMVGFDTLRHVAINYTRFVLGFGGLQCLLLTLLIWELRLRPRDTPDRKAAGRKRSALP